MMRHMHMRHVPVLLAALALVAACTSHHSSARSAAATPSSRQAGQAAGVISGVAEPCTGPAGVQPGTQLSVILRRGGLQGRPLVTRRVSGPPFPFEFKVPAGDYVLVVQGDPPVAVSLGAGEHRIANVTSNCF